MRLDRASGVGELKVADFAAATDRGTERVRSLLAPILPVLYTFVARRTPDAQDAVDLLVETLLRARAAAEVQYQAQTPLLPWLLRIAERSLASDMHEDRRRQSGLAPNWVVPSVPMPSNMLDVVATLPHDQRLVLGMRFGDGLPVGTIADVLGKDERATSELIESAAFAVQQQSFPITYHSPRHHTEFEEYVSSLLEGRSPPVATGMSRGTRAALETLASLRGDALLTPAQEARVWRRYDEEREEFLPGRPLPALPSWLLPASLAALLLITLVGGGLWYLGRRTDSPASVAAPIPTATAVRGGEQAGAGSDISPSPRPEATGERLAGVALRTNGSLYYVRQDAERSYSLVQEYFNAATGQTQSRVLVTEPGERLVYAVSPDGFRIAYSTGDTVWLKEGEYGTERELFSVNPLSTPNGPLLDRSVSTIRDLAWHPDGHTLAAVSDGAGLDAPGAVRVWTVRLPSLEVTREYVLYTSREVAHVSWSASGRYLAASTDTGPLILQMKGPKRASRPMAVARTIAWSPPGVPDRLLWVEAALLSSKVSWGIFDPATMGYEFQGEASYAAWHRDGRSVVTVDSDRQGGSALRFSLHNISTGEWRRLTEFERLGDTYFREMRVLHDGRHLVYINNEGVHMVDYTTGEIQALVESRMRISRLSWHAASSGSPLAGTGVAASGTVLYVEALGDRNADARRLVAVNLEDGRRSFLLGGDDLQYDVSAAGSTVAVTTGSTLSLLDLTAGDRRVLEEAEEGSRLYSPSLSPTGEKLVFLKQEERAGGQYHTSRLHIKEIESGSELVFLQISPTDVLRSVSYSPSGRWLLLHSARAWSLLDLTTGQRRNLPNARRYEWEPEGSRDHLLRVGPGATVMHTDGSVERRWQGDVVDALWLSRSSVLTLSSKGEVTRYDRQEREYQRVGTVLVSDRAPDWDSRMVAVSPNGERLLYSDGGSPSKLWLVNTDTGERAHLAKANRIEQPGWAGDSGSFLPALNSSVMPQRPNTRPPALPLNRPDHPGSRVSPFKFYRTG